MTYSRRIIYFLITGSLLFPLVLTGTYFLALIQSEVFTAWLIGWLIVFIGFVFELLLAKRGLTADDKSFARNTLWAISVRLFTTLILVFICLVFLELNQNNFIFSILIFYFFYIFIEIFYLNFK